MAVYYQMQQVLLQTATEVSYKKGKSFLLQNATVIPVATTLL